MLTQQICRLFFQHKQAEGSVIRRRILVLKNSGVSTSILVDQIGLLYYTYTNRFMYYVGYIASLKLT